MKHSGRNLKDRPIWFRRAQLGLHALLLVASGAIYVQWIRPENARQDGARRLTADAEAGLCQDQSREKDLVKADAELAVLRLRASKFDKEMPRRMELAQFINDVTRISQDASVKNLSWHLDFKPRQFGGITELPILLSFEGDFQSDVINFLRAAEDLPRLTRISKLEITADESDQGRVKAELTMNIYCGGQ